MDRMVRVLSSLLICPKMMVPRSAVTATAKLTSSVLTPEPSGLARVVFRTAPFRRVTEPALLDPAPSVSENL